MRHTRIRYKKLFLAVLVVLCILALVVYGAIHLIARSSAPSSQAGGAGATKYCLFIGIRESDAPQADSLLLTAVNPVKKEVYTVSLPGNTRISRDSEPMMLLKDAYVEGGTEKTISAVENMLHIRIDRYAVFDNTAFSNMISRFGGVDLYVEQDMYHEDEFQTPDIQLRRGFQTLTDGNAYGYMRYIDKDNGEIGRLQREERFFKALYGQSRKNFRLYTWGLIRYYWAPADSNLSNTEAASMAYDMLGYPEENFHLVILPGETKKSGAVPYWYVNPVELQKIVGLTINQ